MFNTKIIRFHIGAFILLFCFTDAQAQLMITDTIYYNQFWKICEKPVAYYYRAGVLAALHDKWFYTGPVKDHKMDNTLIMEGRYTEHGIKHGDYKFYYPNGKLMVTGKYKDGMLVDKWNWYYPDGKEEAIIDFSSAEESFQFIKFNDSLGHTLLENGNGDFSWYSDPFEWEHFGYLFTGSYKDGKRSGTWNFDPYPKKEKNKPSFRIKYDKSGKPKTNEYDFPKGMMGYTYMLSNIPPYKFAVTEQMVYDDLFRINGDTAAKNALAYYLIENKPTEVELRYKVFNVAFNTILNTLEHYKYKLHFTQDKEVNGKLEFKIGSKGFLEDIHFDGIGLDIGEMNFFTFLLGKFKHVEMPGDQHVGQETNYTIYVFSLDYKEVIPDNVPITETRGLVFSFKTREKVEKYLHDNKDELKKMNKEKRDLYYQDSNH